MADSSIAMTACTWSPTCAGGGTYRMERTARGRVASDVEFVCAGHIDAARAAGYSPRDPVAAGAVLPRTPVTDRPTPTRRLRPRLP